MHLVYFSLFLVISVVVIPLPAAKKGRKSHYTTKKQNSATKTECMQLDKTLRAQHRTCFLRPDTGPCRADILQWYFDVRMRKCYRFFWGGCQGNGNRFESQAECKAYCHLNTTNPPVRRPFFCELAFDYGTCFGAYNRWTYDKMTQTCRRRLYSGCGGNQNNFETRRECRNTCIDAPNNSMSRFNSFNICVPYNIEDLNK